MGIVMRKILALAMMALSILIAPALCSLGGNMTTELGPEILGQANETNAVITPEEINLWMQERTLSQERIFWTRMAIMSILLDSGDKNPVIDRLLRNPSDMAETIAPYYGNKTSKEYGDLIKNQLMIAIQLATAAKEKNQTALQDASNRWYKNADDIARFESNMSSRLAQKDRKALWYQHLNLTKDEIMQLSNKDYNSSINTFDRIEEQASLMADSLTNGIVLKISAFR